MKHALVLLTTLLSIANGYALDAPLRDQVRTWRRAHERQLLEELKALVAIPNLASDAPNIKKNAELLQSMLQRRGIKTKLLESPGSPPVVFGELGAEGARRTLMFYAHYDGQPVTPAEWATPPWQPVLRDTRLEDGGREVALPNEGPLDPEWRLYARSASDDKAPIVAMLAAIDALNAIAVQRSVNLKFFFEGEEEAGSPHLSAILQAHRAELAADAWIMCDGPVHQSGRKTIAFGARGVQSLELTVYGPGRALHSGHYGNWAPNPGVRLLHLVGGMRDDDGRITIDGYAKTVRPLSAAEKNALAAIPDVGPELRTQLLLGASEAKNAPIAERILMPALNLRGFSTGAVAESAANAIPVEARASLDLRLVPDQRPDVLKALLEQHITKEGWFIVRAPPDPATRLAHDKVIRVEWGSGYPAQRTSMELPLSRAIIAAVQAQVDAPLVILPSMGGSLPLYLFDQVLDTPPITVPIVNFDNNQHAANENVRLGHLWDGIEIFVGLLTLE